MKYVIKSDEKALKTEREKLLFHTFLTLFPKPKEIFPEDLVNIIKQYSDEGITLTLSDMEIAKLALIDFGSLIKQKGNLTQGAEVRVSPFRNLPTTVLQLQHEMKLPAKDCQENCPDFSYYDNYSDVYFYRSLNLISSKKPENYNSDSIMDCLSDKDLEYMDDIRIPKNEDKITSIIYYSPFQMILKLEMAKDAHYKNVLDQNFSKASILPYLRVVKNLENFKRLYKNYLGYLDITPFKTVIIDQEMTTAILAHVSPPDVRDTDKDVLKGLDGIPRLMRALIVSKIRCLQMDFNGLDGYCGLIGKESMPTLLAIPGVKERYQSKRYANDSLTGSQLVKEVELEIAKQKEELPIQQSKLNVLTHLVKKLQYVYHDPAGNDFQTIQKALSQSDHQMTLFLQKGRQFESIYQLLGSFGLQKGNTPTFDIAMMFVDIRQREAAQIFQEFCQKMPDLHAEVFATNSSSSSSASSSSSNPNYNR